MQNNLNFLLTNTSEYKPGNESSNVDIDDISKQVDESGNTILPNELFAVDEENDFRINYLNTVDDYRKITVEQVTRFTDESRGNINKCPIYISQNGSDQSLFITAYITGIITDVYDYVDLLEILNVATAADKIYIFIDSPGGFVSTGAHIASCISRCKAKVITVARGICASAGSLIWSAGDVCLLSPFAVFMYHMSSHMDFGNSYGIMRRASNMVTYVKTVLLKNAYDKGHITDEDMDNLANNTKNVYIDAVTMQKRLNAVKKAA